MGIVNGQEVKKNEKKSKHPKRLHTHKSPHDSLLSDKFSLKLIEDCKNQMKLMGWASSTVAVNGGMNYYFKKICLIEKANPSENKVSYLRNSHLKFSIRFGPIIERKSTHRSY